MPPSSDIPNAAWKRRYSQILEDPGQPVKWPVEVWFKEFGTFLRTKSAERRFRKIGREPLELIKAIQPGPVMGVPIGGLGGGTITRGWRGDFPRFQMHPGRYDYGDVAADAFSLYVHRPGERPKVRALRAGRPESGALAGWNWSLEPKKTTYYALHPRAWTVYEDVEPGIRLTCRQVSPFLPGNYRESSYPVGVFVWTIENTGERPAEVGLMFTMQNGTGTDNDRAGGHHNERFDEEGASGVLMHHAARLPRWPDDEGKLPVEGYHEDPLTFAIAARTGEGVEVTTRARWLTNSSGMDVWGDFREDGKLENLSDTKPSAAGSAVGGAVAATVSVPPGESREVAFALAWDMPLARFPSGTAWYRRYTRFYGRGGDAAGRIARDALMSFSAWEEQIEAWQRPILDNPDLPDWFKTALFNELYFLADGGTIWTDGAEGDPPLPEDQIGKFAYLEGHEYRMYNTYDVHYYASWALAQLWPELQLSIQRDFAESIALADDEIRPMSGSGGKAPRKVAGAVPHDLGGPTEDLWRKLNVYYLSDSSQWKDLNPKFALQVYRDYALTKNDAFLREVWPAVKMAMAYTEEADQDGDGLIENNGPDQTYDTWEMFGASAYCGGLWLASLQAAAAMADVVGEPEAAAHYRDLLTRGSASYEELLWNDEYYDFDTSPGRNGRVIMAGAMSGHWYLRASGLDPVIPADHARSHLQKVYETNVLLFEDGEMGAVNGMLPNGAVHTGSLQSQEVWAGTTYALAAAMIHEGMREEAFKTARGIYQMTYHDLGYWFATPEAWDINGNYRSLAYMRPLAIWAMQWALQNPTPSSGEGAGGGS